MSPGFHTFHAFPISSIPNDLIVNAILLLAKIQIVNLDTYGEVEAIANTLVLSLVREIMDHC